MENMLNNSRELLLVGAVAAMTSASTVSTTQTGNVIDVTGFEGVVGRATFSSMEAAAVVRLRYQDSPTTVSSDFQTVKVLEGSTGDHGAVSAGIMMVLDIVKPLRPYGRFQVSALSGNVQLISLTGQQYGNRRGPTTQSTGDVLKSETAVSPTT